MKRNPALLLILLSLLIFLACADPSGVIAVVPPTDEPTAAPTAEPTAAPAPEPTPKPTTEPTPLPIRSAFNNDNSAARHRETVYGNFENLRDLYELAAEIGNRYGIVVCIADLVPQSVLWAGNEEQNDHDLIQYALTETDRILSAYPDGFFDQLVYGDYADLELYIVGFSSIGMGYVSSRMDDDGREHSFLLLDAEEDTLISFYDYTLPHEITHLADFRLRYLSERQDDLLFSETRWMEQNPEGFQYSSDWSVTEEMYDQYYEWFQYSYGAENPLEDRATLFGTLMHYAVGADVDRDTVPFTQPCLDKLTFYVSCIRDGFDTTGWPEETVWEAALRKLEQIKAQE